MNPSGTTPHPTRSHEPAAVTHAVKHRARQEFDSWAKSYDASIVQHLLFQPAYRMFMEELYRWRRADEREFDLLDIGSGTGSWVAMVAGSGLPARRLVGLDYSASMCGVASAKAAALDLGEQPPSAATSGEQPPPAAELPPLSTGRVGEGFEGEADSEITIPLFINGDSEHLPFPDESFDVLTCSHSFHHYPHQAAAVREMKRILRPGGRLMLIDGFRDNVIGWVLFDVFITRAESTPEAKVFHAPWSTMRKYFDDAGFIDVRQRKTGIWAPIFLTVGVA